MGAKFSSELAAQGGVVSLKLRGVIDEDNELTGIESQLSAGVTVLDLADIERINSCGVRDWVNWLGRIEKLGARLGFVNCSPSIVARGCRSFVNTTPWCSSTVHRPSSRR